jgi:LAS superfamily LD-carboxypeptidase LdcB
MDGKSRIDNKMYLGVVEDNNDPKHLGRVKVRVQSVFDSIPTQDIPWAMPYKDVNGNQFSVPENGKVVGVLFNGSIYKPEFIYAEHYNINLENKLKSLSDEDYATFKAVQFDASTQIYRTKSEGLKLDHEYSNINLDSNGNINLNARDNDSKVNVGSPDATQAAILGTAFMEWMDKFVLAMQSNAAFQAGGSPVATLPNFQEILNEYQQSRTPKFLSKNVWIVDNDEVLAQKRPYINQQGDNWKSTTETNSLTKIDNPPYTPVSRPETGRPINKDNSVPNDTFQNTISSEASAQTITNVNGLTNGQIPTTNMKLNKYLSKNLDGDAAYLIAEASDALDAMISAFNSSNFTGKQKIVFTDGYRSLARQQALYAKYGAGRAATPGKSNHGWGIAVDMFWGVKTSMYKDNSKRPSGYKHPNYVWFLNNGYKYGWYNPTNLRDDSGTDEWWHWEYHGKKDTPDTVIIPNATRYKGEFTQADINNIKSSGGSYS